VTSHDLFFVKSDLKEKRKIDNCRSESLCQPESIFGSFLKLVGKLIAICILQIVNPRESQDRGFFKRIDGSRIVDRYFS
jgi:hypothetical protein